MEKECESCIVCDSYRFDIEINGELLVRVFDLAKTMKTNFPDYIAEGVYLDIEKEYNKLLELYK